MSAVSPNSATRFELSSRSPDHYALMMGGRLGAPSTFIFKSKTRHGQKPLLQKYYARGVALKEPAATALAAGWNHSIGRNHDSSELRYRFAIALEKITTR